MYATPDLLSIPFQYWIFAAATLLNIMLGLTGLIGQTISLCIRAFTREVALHITAPPGGARTVREAIQKTIEGDRADLGADNPVGRVIGVIERELYLYALIVPIHGLITAVLLFKAFSGWLKMSDVPAAADVLSSSEMQGLRTLARYYSYAIGNFISLAWAIVIFEGIRVAMRLNPQIAFWLMIKP